MNQIYRSLWNGVSRTFVAVSENVRARAKRAGSTLRGRGSGVAREADSFVERAGLLPGSSRPRRVVRSAVRPLALEQRLMFDAAAVATAADTAAAAAIAAAAEQQAAQPEAHATALPPAAVATEAARHVLFVDARVRDAAALTQNAAPESEIVHIDREGEGLKQIADYLAAYPGASSAQIVAHGNAGDLWLGSTYLSAENLQTYGTELQRLGNAMIEGSDILIFACDTGAGERGALFVDTLSELTGRDVAASDDRTGAGGDWDLEIVTGAIDAAPSFSLASAGGYAYDLATITVSTNADAGAGSLRNAISSALSGDTITFNAGMTVTLTSGQLALNENLTIDGDLDNNGTADVTVDANHNSRVFSMTTGTVTIDGLVITRGLVYGNGGAYNSLAGGDALGAGISITGGTLTIRNSSIAANKAAGGGGNGGGAGYGYGGGGGGGFGGKGGGNGGAYAAGYLGSPGGGGTGGNGGYYSELAQAGKGGSSSGGAGGTAVFGFAAGGSGGTAGSAGTGFIGGGGAGAGASYASAIGRGGNAVGGMYIAGGATVYMSSTSISNNLGAGGGGGGSSDSVAGANGGIGVGGIWNRGNLFYNSATVGSSANHGAGGAGGGSQSGQPPGSSGSGSNTGTETFVTTGGSTDPNWSANAAPTTSGLNGDSVAWAGVGGTVILDSGGNADLGDTDLEALNSGNGDWAGASLAVQRSGAAISADTFGFNTSGALFTVSGGNLQSGGQTFATFTNSGGVLSISLTSSGTTATTALVNDVAQRITYRSDTPAGDAAVRLTLSDGAASTTADVTVTSDAIYVTDTSDTGTIDASNGAGLREAVAIAAADATGLQTIILTADLAGQTITLGSTLNIAESLTLNIDSASGVFISSSSLSLGGGTTLSFVNDSGDTATINSTLAGTGGLAKSGAGSLTLGSTSNNAGWSGAMAVTGGSLIANTGTRLSSGVLTLDGGTLSMTVIGAAGTTTTVANTVALGAGGGTISIGGGGANIAHFTGVISGGNLTKTAAAILQLGGSNTYAGTTTVAAGTLSLGDDAHVGSGTITLAAGTTLALTGADTYDNSIALAGAATVSNSTAVNLSGTVSGAFQFTKAGSGTMTLSGSNSYAGTNLSAGTLLVASDANLGSGDVILAGGTLFGVSGSTTIDNNFFLAGDATINAAAAFTISGTISGGSNLTKAGASILTLSGGNTYTGTTTVSAGTLGVGSDGNLGSGSLALDNGATLAVTGATTIDNAIALAGTAVVSNASDVTLSGVVSGNNLTKSSGAALTLTGSNTYTGVTNVNAGTLRVGSDANLGAGSVNLANGTTLDITNAITIDNALALTGVVTVNAGAAATLSGVIGGGGGLTKIGASNLTLSANNTYTGTTTVSAGTVIVTGATAGATTVSSGATLAGSGTLGGTVTVNSGGSLAPGSSPGTLTINGNLSMGSGSTLAIEINGTTAGTDYDQIVVNGAVDITAVTLSVTHNYVPGEGDACTIIVNDAADAITGTFSGLAQGGTLAAGGNGTVLTASYIGGTGNDFTLTAPINAAPTIGNLNADSVSLVQGSGAILLDDSSNATVTDGDSADFDGGNVTASVVTNAVAAEDVLGIRHQGTGAGQIGVAGSDITYGGSIIGSYTGGGAGVDLVISLNGVADASATQALVRNLTYNNSNATNSIGQADRTVRITVDDGDGGSSSNADVTVTVIETVPPATSGIVVSDSALAVGETSVVTITFSEVVTGLTTEDFTVGNGALSGLSSGDGGITWTATLTPDPGVEDPSNLIMLDNTGYTDLAGNAGSGATDSNNYSIDTLRPTATVVVADAALAAGETTNVSIAFSEAVSGLTVGDFSIANGVLSTLSSSDGGTTWTATLTPDADVEDASNLIVLANTGVIDAAANTGSGTTDSNNYAIDTLRPTVVGMSVADTALAVGETTTLTITFSEAVTGLTGGDFTVPNGALSGLSSGDGGITWTATLTPPPGVADATNVITLDNTGYTDAAGNTGIGTTDSNNYDVDTEAPMNAVPGAQATSTVTPLVFSSANGNAITVSDGGSLTVVVSVADGSMTATTGGGAVITNNGTSSVTLSGTAAQVNAALEGLSYAPIGAGSRSIGIQSTDSTGNSDTDTVAVTINNATLVVTSNLDTGTDETAAGSFAVDQADGSGLSIREALHWARGGDTITFDLDGDTPGQQGGTIVLNGNQLTVNDDALLLDGDLNDDGTADVTVSGNNTSRVIAVNPDVTGVEVTGLALTEGLTGGGGAGLSAGLNSSVTIRDSVISNNTDVGGGGGGVFGIGAALTVINTTISANTSTTFGGGIRAVGAGGSLALINSTVEGNTTTGINAHGGGVQFGGSNGLTIINGTFSGNAVTGAGSLGGGIRITTGTTFVYNTTVVGNAAAGGSGGINASGSSDTFVNVVVAGNTSGAGATAAVAGSPLATGGIADDVGNTVETATSSYFGSNVAIGTNNGSLDNQGTTNLLLGTLVDNGGNVRTHRPQVGSALIDGGSNAALPADAYDLDGDSDTAERLPIDANGNDRVSVTVDIGAVESNTPPALTGLNGGATYVENGSAVVIDADVSVSDNETDQLNGGNGDYNGASVVIARNGGAVATDRFGFSDGSGISLSGGNLLKSGQAIASFDTATAGRVSVGFTNANGEAPTTTDVNAILRQITFSSSSDDPGTGGTLDWTFTDSAGGSAAASASVSLTPVNDAPTATNLTQTVTYTEGAASVALGDIVLSDPDSGEMFSATLTLSHAAAGTLSTGTFGAASSTYDTGTGAWTASGTISDVNAALAAVAFTPAPNWDQDATITTRIRDAADTGPADGAIALDVTPAPDAPTLANAIADQDAIEDTPYTFTVPVNTFADVDTGDILNYAAVLTDGAPLPAWLALDPGTRTFSGTPANGDVGSFTVMLTATDSGGASASTRFDVTVSNTNDAPTGEVTIDGTMQVGNILSARHDLADDDGLGVLGYQWQVMEGDSWTSIAGATGSTLLLDEALIVETIRVVASYTDGRGSAESVASSPVGPAPFVPPPVFPVAAPAAPSLPPLDTHSSFEPVSAPAAGPVSFLPPTSEAGVSGFGLESSLIDPSLPAVSVPEAFRVALVPPGSGQGEGFVVGGIPDVTIQAGGETVIRIPADAFAHSNPNAGVALFATLGDGRPLPGWIRFDPLSGTFTVMPPPGLREELSVRIIARDSEGREAVLVFELEVDAPRDKSQGRGPQGALEGRSGLSEQLRMAAEPLGLSERLIAISRAAQAAAQRARS